MIRFSKVKEYRNNPNVVLPTRSTANSAGYDFVVPEAITIPSMYNMQNELATFKARIEGFKNKEALSLKDVAYLTKETKCKPTLVPTGIKCYLESDTYLQLSVRSSCPLKHWLILANGVGRRYADYKSGKLGESFQKKRQHLGK